MSGDSKNLVTNTLKPYEGRKKFNSDQELQDAKVKALN